MIYWQWQAWRDGTFELGDFGLRAPDDGAPTDRSCEVESLASLYRENREIFATVKRQAEKIAILVSADTFIHKMLFQLDHPNVGGYAHDANYALFGCFRALEAANLVSEFISEEQIEAGELNRYEVLYLPGIEVMRQKVADKICEFVVAGGNVYADGRTAYLDEHMYLRNRIPGHNLPELFGAKEADFIALQVRTAITANDGSQARCLAMEQRLKLLGGEASAFFTDGSIAVVDNCYGKGRTRLVGAQLCRALREYNDADTLQYVAGFACQCGVKPIVNALSHVNCRRLEGKSHDVLFVFNNTDEAVDFELPMKIKSIRSLYRKCTYNDVILRCRLEENDMDVIVIKK